MDDQYIVILAINSILSLVAYWLTTVWIPKLMDPFIKAKRFGIDCHKKDKPVMYVLGFDEFFSSSMSYFNHL